MILRIVVHKHCLIKFTDFDKPNISFWEKLMENIKDQKCEIELCMNFMAHDPVYKFQMISLRETQFIERKLEKLECSENQGYHNSRTKKGKVRNQTWPGFYRLWPCVIVHFKWFSWRERYLLSGHIQEEKEQSWAQIGRIFFRVLFLSLVQEKSDKAAACSYIVRS